MFAHAPIRALRLTLASPEMIRAWSFGEVTEPETINYRTQQPEPNGLFSERIFGPIKNGCCFCGKYKRVRKPGTKCEKCGVELTSSSVRRQRMGHINLVVPIAHPWFAKSAPSIIALLLDLSPRQLNAILSYSAYVVLAFDEARRSERGEKAEYRVASDQNPPGQMPPPNVGDVLDEEQYRALSSRFGQAVHASTGAEAIRELLNVLDLEQLATQLHQEIRLNTPQGQKGD